MSAVAPDGIPPRSADSSLPLRPSWLLSVPLDAICAVLAYLGAYWLRFTGERLELFLPGAWSTMPEVVVAQIAGLLAAGAYMRLPRVDWLLRVIAGIAAGTVAGGIVVGLTMGFEGVSRGAFAADAVLLTVGALGWRGMWVFRMRARMRAAARTDMGELVDRTVEMTTIRSVVRSLIQYRELLKNLVLKDLKLKYRGSVFGFLWSLANPLLMTVVYTIAFTYILRIRTEAFVFYLLLGVLAWTFFANSASMSTGAIADNAGLLKSLRFPRAILPIETVLFNLAQYLLTVSVFLPMMLIWYRVPLGAPMLLFPVFLALQVILTIGVALFLATATAFFRDVRHLLEVALAVLFWTTPILYELKQVPDRIQLLVLLSPASPFIIAYHDMFYYGEWPNATIWLMAAAHATGAFLIGALLFMAAEDRFTEQI
jgi:ABC-2 type transport system permease protein